MSLAAIILLVLKVSIVLTVFGFALDATWAEATYLFRNPGKLLRAILSMNVVMLITAVALAVLFDLHPAVKIALCALSLSPVPPFIPGKAEKFGGSLNYVVGLLTAASLLAITLVPFTLEVLQRIFGVPLGMTPWAVVPIVFGTVLAPLGAGILVHAVARTLATRIARPVRLIATILLILTALPLLIVSLPAIWSLIGNGTAVVLLVFVLVGLVAGHLLGGPDPHERMVLAFSSASRHPGMALAIAHANFPQQKLATAAVLLYLLISIVGSIPYQKWIQRRAQMVPSAT